MNEVRFTYDWYGEFLEELKEYGYGFHTFDEGAPGGSVVLRHDVDWSPRKAVRIAEIEDEADVSATYFFLVTSPFYNILNDSVRKKISRIQALGHDVGLHFSTHQYWDCQPDRQALDDRIDRELDVLSKATGNRSSVVSFHNPPEWVINTKFDDFTSTYESRFFEDHEYFADSNQRWRESGPVVEESEKRRVQILTHPVLWGERDGWTTDRLREERDHLYNRIDGFLKETDRTWNGNNGLGYVDHEGRNRP